MKKIKNFFAWLALAYVVIATILGWRQITKDLEEYFRKHPSEK